MNLYAQTLHVARKDLRQHRWTLLALAGAVFAATGALAWWWPVPGSALLAPLSVALLAMLLVAVLIQSDSPTRVDAHWASLPLNPMAVLGAKLILAGGVGIGLVLIGEIAVLVTHDLPAADLPELLGRSFISQHALLGFAAAIAAMTRDLRGFFVALIGLVIGYLIVTTTVEGLEIAGSVLALPSVPYQTSLLVLIGSAIVLVAQFRWRDTARAARIAGGFAVLIVVLPLLQSRPVIARSAIPDDLQPHFELQFDGIGAQGGQQNAVLVVSGGAPDRLYTLIGPRTTLHWDGGATETVGSPIFRLNLSDPALGIGHAARPVEDGEIRGEWLVRLPVELSLHQAEALATGRARLTTSGDLEIREARYLMSLPLEPGATAVADGHRVRIDRFEAGNEIEVELAKSVIDDIDSNTSFAGVPVEYMLVNRQAIGGLEWGDVNHRVPAAGLVAGDAGEGVALQPVNRASTSGWLVAFGSSATTGRVLLRPRGGSQTLDAAWLAGAELLVLDWEEVGRERVTIRSGSNFN